MTTFIDVKTYLYLQEEAKKVADEQGLLTPLDIFMFFQMAMIRRSEKFLIPGSIYEMLQNNYDIHQEKALEAVLDLEKHGLIVERMITVREGASGFYFDFGIGALSRMGLPDKFEEISEQEMQSLMHKKIREAKERIDEWIRVRKAVKEIEDIKKELEKSQRDMLRNMISVFGIFVAIFSFILIGINTALKVEPTGDFLLTASEVLAIVFPIVVCLVILVGASLWLTKRIVK